MRYKTQNDIEYGQFSDWLERIEGLDAEATVNETVRTFYPKSKDPYRDIIEFNKAIETPSDIEFKMNMKFDKAERFIDADTYFTEGLYLELAKMLLIKKHYTIASVNYAVGKFIEYAAPLKEAHEWIYNPPTIYTGKKDSNPVATELRAEFVKHYGAYMEIIYLLTGGDFSKQDYYTDWPVDRFLFTGEYLLRKKRIESI